MQTTLDATAAAGLVALIVTNLMQLLKPFVERIPGIMLPANQAMHDSLLRLLGYGLNFAGLVLVSFQLPSVFGGIPWIALLAIAFGQSVAIHYTYNNLTTEKVDAPANSLTVPLAPRG